MQPERLLQPTRARLAITGCAVDFGWRFGRRGWQRGWWASQRRLLRLRCSLKRWVRVGDVEEVHAEYEQSGAGILQPDLDVMSAFRRTDS
jgi:hypothetical protein